MGTRRRQARHLVARFLGALTARGPDPPEEAWLLGLLSGPEADLYVAQSRADRAHSVDCALAARRSLGPRATTHAIVASALHDVGKAEADLGTPGRVVATLAGAVLADRTVDAWRNAGGARGRIGRYLRHDVRGAELLEGAGSHPTVIAWAREHHLDRGAGSLDPALARVLAQADHEVRIGWPRRASAGGEQPDVGLGPGQRP